jgi:hypothetical protein
LHAHFFAKLPFASSAVGVSGPFVTQDRLDCEHKETGEEWKTFNPQNASVSLLNVLVVPEIDCAHSFRKLQKL